MLIADNAKWDLASKMEAALDDYLDLLDDDKPITVRQCIQGLSRIVLHPSDLGPKIADRLIAFDVSTGTPHRRELAQLAGILSREPKMDVTLLSATHAMGAAEDGRMVTRMYERRPI